MSLTLSSHAIISPTDVAAAALGGMASDVEALNERGALSAICNAVTGEVEQYLSRVLHIHPATMRPRELDWMASPHDDYSYEIWSPVWPAVEITTATATVALGEAYAGGQLLYANSRYTEVAYFAGFRRHDQTLANLQAISGLSALSETPSELPADIFDVAVALALHTVAERTEGRYTGARRVQQIGSSPVTVDAPDPTYRTRLLARLDKYRALNA